jgi:hypothetical protein
MSEGRDHAGILFIDDRTIVQEDAGSQVLALIELWDAACDENWTNVIAFARPLRRA